jgi:LEA14-like dessication related protein
LGRSIEIQAKKSTLISLPLKITYELLFQTVGGLEKEDKAACYVSGSLLFSTGRKVEKIPFAFSGEFPILKRPKIENITLLVNDLTIGGADLIFQVEVENDNGFELFIDKLSYLLKMEGRRIVEGMVKGDKNIESKGKKIFSLPALINFFDVGKEVYNILHQPSAQCQFSGEAEISTIWGTVKTPVEKIEKISFSRSSQ